MTSTSPDHRSSQLLFRCRTTGAPCWIPWSASWTAWRWPSPRCNTRRGRSAVAVVDQPRWGPWVVVILVAGRFLVKIIRKIPRFTGFWEVFGGGKCRIDGSLQITRPPYYIENHQGDHTGKKAYQLSTRVTTTCGWNTSYSSRVVEKPAKKLVTSWWRCGSWCLI